MTLKHLFASAAALTFGLLLAASSALAGPHDKMGGAHHFDKGMQPILQDYLKIQTALAGDTTKGVQAAAKAVAAKAGKLDSSGVMGEHAAHYKDLPNKISTAAKTLAKAGSIEAAREAFKELSKPMAMWGTMAKPAGIDVVFCSMAKASWLQTQGSVRNPYHGASMLTCGEVVGGAGHAAKQMDHGKMDHGKMDHGKMNHGGH